MVAGILLTCAELTANEKNRLFWLICIRLGTFEMPRLNRTLMIIISCFEIDRTSSRQQSREVQDMGKINSETFSYMIVSSI